jgi:FkbM family methyltransferase
MAIKETLRGVFHKVGLDIRRWDDMSVFRRQLIHILKHLEIDLVLDVGAHEGQYAQMLFRTGYSGDIKSFEPLIEHASVAVNALNKNPNWEMQLPCYAIGDERRGVEINIAGGNGSSSSLLPMNQKHLDVAPHTAYTKKHSIMMYRLDQLVAVWGRKPFLKIDTQGYEMQVLMGATGIIDKIKGVQAEMSTVELYEGQALDYEISEWLTSRGFQLWALNPFMYDPKTGKLLQYDAIFVRE